jgi:hypothetical protein
VRDLHVVVINNISKMICRVAVGFDQDRIIVDWLVNMEFASSVFAMASSTINEIIVSGVLVRRPEADDV